MTHDKARQDFEGLTHQTVKELLKLRYNETDEEAVKTFTWAVKQAERAGIREKLESEGVVVAARELYQNSTNKNTRVIPFEQSCEERLRWMFQAKAAITKILEVI